jgi:hypothetical protein
MATLAECFICQNYIYTFEEVEYIDTVTKSFEVCIDCGKLADEKIKTLLCEMRERKQSHSVSESVRPESNDSTLLHLPKETQK